MMNAIDTDDQFFSEFHLVAQINDQGECDIECAALTPHLNCEFYTTLTLDRAADVLMPFYRNGVISDQPVERYLTLSRIGSDRYELFQRYDQDDQRRAQKLDYLPTASAQRFYYELIHAVLRLNPRPIIGVIKGGVRQSKNDPKH